MAVIIGLVALLQIIGGLLVFVSAKSAIHEILGTLSFGMGILSMALTVVIGKLDEIKKANQEAAEIAFGSREVQLKIASAFDRIGRS